jgi:hypothetical protein
MELENLERRWAELDRKLDAAIHLNTHVLRGTLAGKAETALRRLARGLWLELGLNVLAALWLGSFWVDHLAEPRFWLPALGLHLCVMALIVAAVHQLVAITQLDFAAPIITIQKRLEALRILRIRTVMWTLVLSPLLWTPLFIVALKSFFDVDVYQSFSAAWLLANVLLAILLIPVAIWICRRCADRMERSPLLRSLMRDLAGYSLSAATEHLQSLTQFEQEHRQAGPTNA